MGISNTGLLVTDVSQKPASEKAKPPTSHFPVELLCEARPAPFMLRPYAGLYNPFAQRCSILCNHPADVEAKEYVKLAKKDALATENRAPLPHDEMLRIQHQGNGFDKDINKTPHDIVTEEMFRRYAETDSRPLTPAPTLASSKSRGSRRCLTPDQPQRRTAIVVDLRRSHSQETLYYHGYTTSDMTAGHNTGTTNGRSTLPSLNLSEATHGRLLKGQCEQLPPLASPVVLSRRNLPQTKEVNSVRTARKTQLKALNLGKISQKGKTKAEPQASERSKNEKDSNDGSEVALANSDDGGEIRRRGKRRRKPRQGSDRLTSAGLAAQTQQDPETQIAGIGTDSHNPSSRASIAPTQGEESSLALPVIKGVSRKTDSFLDDDILKLLHREVDEEAIETEFDTKRRYVLEEALRTRPERPYGHEMQALLRELKVPAMSLGDWLHIPRVFSRQNAKFSLPIDSYVLEKLSPMSYVARYVTLKKSKQLLYLTVLRKFRPESYRMPISCIKEGLLLMMGGGLTVEEADRLGSLMEWDGYHEEENFADDIKLTINGTASRKPSLTESCAAGDTQIEENCIKFRTWCGVCALCERTFGRYQPRDKDPPDGMELSDFSLLDTKLATLKVHSGLSELLNVIRTR